MTRCSRQVPSHTHTQVDVLQNVFFFLTQLHCESYHAVCGPGRWSSALVRPLWIRVVAACLSITCLTLLSVVITLSLRCKSFCFCHAWLVICKSDAVLPLHRSQQGHFWTEQSTKQPDGASWPPAGFACTPGETSVGAERRKRPAQLDPGSHSGEPELPGGLSLPP